MTISEIFFDETVVTIENAIENKIKDNQEYLESVESDPDVHHDEMMTIIYSAREETFEQSLKPLALNYLTEFGVVKVNEPDMEIPITVGDLQKLIVNCISDTAILANVVFLDQTPKEAKQHISDLFVDVNN